MRDKAKKMGLVGLTTLVTCADLAMQRQLSALGQLPKSIAVIYSSQRHDELPQG